MDKGLRTRTTWVTAAVCGLSILASGWTVQSAPGAEQPGPAADAVRSARDALVAEALKGELTPRLIDLYYRYAEQVARRAAPADKVTDDFWKWFDASPTIREGILAGMDCAYAGHVIGRLAELRSAVGRHVDRYSQLAIAFALVYGRAGDESILLSIRGRRKDAKGRPAPSMIDSFRYYTDNKSEMLFSLQETPWPLLLHVVDNDLPLVKRNWALSRYRGRSLESLRRLLSEVAYSGAEGAHKVVQVATVEAADAIRTWNVSNMAGEQDSRLPPGDTSQVLGVPVSIGKFGTLSLTN